MLKKCLRAALLLVLVFVLVCGLLPPLFRTQTCRVAHTPAQASPQAGRGERVRVLADNTDALVWRLRLIEAAQSELVLSTFQFFDDAGGADVMCALYAAAERGVRVRILVDGFSGLLNLRTSRRFAQLAAHPMVTVRLYNPIALPTLWTVNYRLHDKYLIADERAYILGGRNVSSLFLGDTSSRQNEDRDVLVLGGGRESSMAQLRRYFAQVWDEGAPFASLVRADTTLPERYAALRTRYAPAFTPVDWESETLAADRVTLLSGETQAANKAPEVWAALLSYMHGAREVTILTPYVIMDEMMYASLGEVLRGGTAVRLVTNAPANGANPFGCADYLSEKRRLLDAGLTVAEYWGEHSLHTKALLIDERISILGSFNMDIRSTFLDTELMLVIESTEVNRALRDDVARMTVRSTLHGADAEGGTFTAPRMPAAKTLGYGLLSLLLRPLRALL